MRTTSSFCAVAGRPEARAGAGVLRADPRGFFMEGACARRDSGRETSPEWVGRNCPIIALQRPVLRSEGRTLAVTHSTKGSTSGRSQQSSSLYRPASSTHISS
jgi:hypothetical protein